MWKEAHATAFTVANCAKLDVLRDLQMGIRTMLKEGKPVLRSKDRILKFNNLVNNK